MSKEVVECYIRENEKLLKELENEIISLIELLKEREKELWKVYLGIKEE